ncbi:D-glycero-alpha-D-manno-heptose-1,7-bisphosphate 7-phosphatase [Burkholderia plantarii]|uniref:D-glycero-alpha-D-manno-heptose-1,7-bisphosphate 7-phosphatase n=1 Tax=Burkholderia plantarii TaxID=41899 RepID=UPI0006D89D73|nr:HAD family hydrolase [Burkholderia plantarii]ALK30636.1 Histidinol phosphatase [Burkholderia plantarii]GLZ19669.1 D-glycero-alpha-D-manno-heptose-1,7-bisphosphate 7-phosphatase [Burkholderia plantarii]
MRVQALFLDRDGVVNVDTGYAHRPEQIRFVDGIFELAAAATRYGYKIFTITNQAGIGRGYYTEQAFQILMDWISERFAETGGTIERTYFCPHHPKHGVGKYRRLCECRKPAPGMLLEAARDYDIDLARSIFVGDKQSDMAAGQQAGVGTLLYIGDELDFQPDIKLTSPVEAIAYLHAGNGTHSSLPLYSDTAP